VAKTQNRRECEICRRKNLSSRERTEAAAEADNSHLRADKMEENRIALIWNQRGSWRPEGVDPLNRGASVTAAWSPLLFFGGVKGFSRLHSFSPEQRSDGKKEYGRRDETEGVREVKKDPFVKKGTQIGTDQGWKTWLTQLAWGLFWGDVQGCDSQRSGISAQVGVPRYTNGNYGNGKDNHSTFWSWYRRLRPGGLPPTSVSFLTSEKIHVHFVTNFLNALVPCDEPSG
jgi:hypothetical protein